jgi:ketosteroid isomerase-like protein
MTSTSKKQISGNADEIEAAFYDALSRADIDALMALWAEDEEIVCVHPGGSRLVGHAAIRASWTEIFQQGNARIRPVQLHITQNVMSAVHNIIEEAKSRADDPQDTHIIATNVYLKTPQGWRMVAHHASIASGRAPNLPPKSAVLH